MRGPLRKWFIAVLLSLAAATYVVELSGRWDQSLQDANDEAAIVAIVLCVGAALSITGALLKARLAPLTRQPAIAAPAAAGRSVRRFRSVTLGCSPPISLRI